MGHLSGLCAALRGVHRMKMKPATAGQEESDMELSARNQLRGTVKSIALGGIMAEVAVDVGGNEIVAAITRGSVERLDLKEGDDVSVVIKATEVMIAK